MQSRIYLELQDRGFSQPLDVAVGEAQLLQYLLIVLSQQRWRAVQSSWGKRKLDRYTSLLDGAQGGMVHLEVHLPVEQLGVGEHLGQVVDWATGNIDRLKLFDPFLDRPAQEEFL